jgi:bifunctional non-homologous end joining protein LigD
MLASSISEWPGGSGWVLEPKYDGYRLMLETKATGRVLAWSRHGTSLTANLGELLAPMAAVGAGWVFDGELIALSDREGSPVQDFAAVGRAVFGGDQEAIASLHYVAFDVLATSDGGDIQASPWLRRTAVLANRLPADRRLRVASTLPADPDTHARLVSMGFEGSVLKRQNSTYRAGRSRSWRKLKAQHTIGATIRRLDRDRDGRLFARCVLADGRPCSAWVPAAAEPTHEETTIVYSRVDANGSLREPRLASNSVQTVVA